MAETSITMHIETHLGETIPITLTVGTGRGTTIAERVPLVVGGPTA